MTWLGRFICACETIKVCRFIEDRTLFLVPGFLSSDARNTNRNFIDAVCNFSMHKNWKAKFKSVMKICTKEYSNCKNCKIGKMDENISEFSFHFFRNFLFTINRGMWKSQKQIIYPMTHCHMFEPTFRVINNRLPV